MNIVYTYRHHFPISVCAHYCVPSTVSVSMGKTHNWHLIYMDTRADASTRTWIWVQTECWCQSLVWLGSTDLWTQPVNRSVCTCFHSEMLFQTRKVMNILITADTGDAICIIYCVVCVCLCWNAWSFFTFRSQAWTPAKTGGFQSCGEQSLHTRRTSISRFNTEIFPEPKLKTATWRCANEGCVTVYHSTRVGGK